MRGNILSMTKEETESAEEEAIRHLRISRISEFRIESVQSTPSSLNP